MAGPSTEYLAEQLDRIRDEVQATRREGLDGWKQLNDTFAGQIREVRESLGEEMVQLRREVGASMEAIKVDQALSRENIARLETKSDATIERIDRTHEFLKQLLFWGVSLVATVGGGIFWKASQAVNRIDEHGRRIESLEKKSDDNQAKLLGSLDKANDNQVKLRESFDKANDNQAKLRESFDLMRKTLDERLPVPARP